MPLSHAGKRTLHIFPGTLKKSVCYFTLKGRMQKQFDPLIEIVPLDDKPCIPERSCHKARHKPGIEVHDQIELLGGDRFAQPHELLYCGHEVIGPLWFADADDIIHLWVKPHDLVAGFIAECSDRSAGI